MKGGLLKPPFPLTDGRIMDVKINKNGFSLPELMVTVIILAIVFVGILMSFIRCMDLNELSRNSSISIAAVKSRMEQINNSAFNKILADYNNTVFTTSGLNGIGASYVTIINSNLLRVTSTFCWRQKNGRIIGEDTNLNGQLDAGEDLNGDGMIDSPVRILTYVYNK